MFNFTPLLGAQSSVQASQSLLQFDDGIKILVDVGWGPKFDPEELKQLEKHIPTLSLVLLTHATPAHIAAYAHCCKHFPLFLQIPVYATQPVASLGRTLLQDLYSSTPLAATVIPPASLEFESLGLDDSQILLQPPTRDEIASYFQRINPLKYSQPHEPTPSSFSPPLNGLTITAYNAGHSLGGTIWHILHGMESVVYAVDWNQVRENVYNRAAWLTSGGGAEIIEQLRKPTALICSSRGIEKTPHAGGRNKRDELLLDMLRTTLAKGGTVLVPTDSSARVLELAYVVEHAWRQHAKADHPFHKAKTYLASKSIGATMRYARSMLEWMDESMAREAEADPSRVETSRPREDATVQASKELNGPFDFHHVRLVERKNQLERILSRDEPKVILASDSTLEWGFSRDVLLRIAGDSRNLVILTEDPSTAITNNPGIGQTLWKWFNDREHGVAVESGSDGQTFEQIHTGGSNIEYGEAMRIPLEGAELDKYQRYLAQQRQAKDLEGMNEPAIETAGEIPDDAASASSSDSEESDDERQGKALNYSTAAGQAKKQTAGKAAVGVNMLLKEPNTYDYDVRGKKGREAIFPTSVKRKRLDEFGEVIRPEDYLRAEERDEADAQEIKDTSREHALGQKRKWGDVDLIAQKDRQSATKRRKSEDYTSSGHDEDEDEPSDNDEEEETFVPSKLTLTTATVQVQLRLGFVDFAGIHDQRNMSLLIPLINPRKIVLVGGSTSDTSFLAHECRQKLAPNDASPSTQIVFTPFNGETVEASMDTNAWTVRLSDALVRQIHWQNVGKLDVMTLAGRLGSPASQEPEDSRAKRQKTLKSENETKEEVASDGQPPTLDVLPANFAGGTRSVAQPLHVGDLRLADLRKILLSEGHTADFRGQGTLVVDGRVAVRKSAGGRIEIESGEGLGSKPGASRHKDLPFVAVKKRIYEGLAIIAGR